ncbi:MAG: Crp/Fnr family transcriptional regulator [Gammaproteobacteria bacterium]|nr:Crp/Fnr family transcriptional regulator [Gammaproteobacteria bacterium]
MINSKLPALVIEQMRTCVLFMDLTQAQLDRVVAQSHLVKLEQGEFLFKQGQKMEHFFMLSSGQMKLTRLAIDGTEKVIDIVQPGATFAEAVMFMGGAGFPVNAEVVAAAGVAAIKTTPYLEALSQSTQACFSLMARMSERLHWQVNEIDRLTLHNATFRVVAYLLDQARNTAENPSQLELRTPKQVIASRLSITPETLSRTLRRLVNEGLIDVRDNHIELKDSPKLRLFLEEQAGQSSPSLGPCRVAGH